MDPFEARLQFVKLLQRLNASVQAIESTIDFLGANRDLEEDLYACILQELGATSLNVRLNIFYFLESLCEQVTDPNFWPGNRYKENVSRDLVEIFNKVVPPGRLGLVNLAAAQQVVQNLQHKQVLNPLAFEPLDSAIEERTKQLTASPVLASTNTESGPLGGNSHNGTPSGSLSAADSTGPSNMSTGPGSMVVAAPSGPASNEGLRKEDVLRRMDEDRERHKRLKENIWAINYKTNPDFEFETTWESTGPVSGFDLEQIREENEIWLASWSAK